MQFERLLIFLILISCKSNSGDDVGVTETNTNSEIHIIPKINDMDYEEQLEATKKYYPFSNWRESYNEGLEQYTEENCNKTRSIFDSLIAGLIEIGQNANEGDKVQLFKTAVLSLNNLNDQVEGLIETGEREDLCELIDQITIAAGMNPENYADGEGIADEWRDW